MPKRAISINMDTRASTRHARAAGAAVSSGADAFGEMFGEMFGDIFGGGRRGGGLHRCFAAPISRRTGNQLDQAMFRPLAWK